jgi:hypothetical protein
MLLLVFFGCATVPPQPVTIKHERTPSQYDAAMAGQRYWKEPVGKYEGTSSQSDAGASNQQSPKEPADVSIAALVDLLKKKNVISAEEGDRIIAQSENQAASEKQSLQAQVKSEVQEELPNEVEKVAAASAAPEWTKRIQVNGDVRLRYQANYFSQNNASFAEPSNPSQLMNTTINEDRYYYRVRLGVVAHVNDQVDAVIRLSTGNQSTPVSTNQIIGTYFNRGGVMFDLAYLQWKPWEFLTVWGGRMPNPWFSSPLVWARDLNFEGLSMTVRKPVTASLVPFLTVGAFPLQQNDFSQHNKWLVAGQVGLENINQKGVAAKFGAAYYYFSNITGVANNPADPDATDWTAPLYQQKGNTLFNISATPNVITTALAAEFKELNLTGNIDIGFWDPYHILFLGNYVNNLGFNQADVAQNTGNPNQPRDTLGYQVGMAVGYPVIQDFGQWNAQLDYRYVEGDAVVDAFNDSDFHLGGTNAKGWTLETDVGLLKNVWLMLRWMTAQEVSGPPLSIDVLQVDINARF